MFYSLRKADRLAKQLEKFVHAYAHIVVGQFANLDFWLDETKSALRTLDEYRQRFDKMRDAQLDWVSEHDTKIYRHCPVCGGRCEFATERDGTPDPPVRAKSSEMREIRQQLVDAAYHFMLRCYRIGHLDEDKLRDLCDSIGTSVDPGDL